MSFDLPEDDEEFLERKALKHERHVDGQTRGLVFPAFRFNGNLWRRNDKDELVRCEGCDLLILVPAGYATTKLDSFYTAPHLKRPDGSTDPVNANGTQNFFGRTWQFWSRHLKENEWRPGIDGLSTYLPVVLRELGTA
jgi:hypothetical protein